MHLIVVLDFYVQTLPSESDAQGSDKELIAQKGVIAKGICMLYPWRFRIYLGLKRKQAKQMSNNFMGLDTFLALSTWRRAKVADNLH